MDKQAAFANRSGDRFAGSFVRAGWCSLLLLAGSAFGAVRQTSPASTCLYTGSKDAPLAGYVLSGPGGEVWIFGAGAPRVWSGGDMRLATEEEAGRLGLPLQAGQRFVFSPGHDAVAIETIRGGQTTLTPLAIPPDGTADPELVLPGAAAVTLGAAGRQVVGLRPRRGDSEPGFYRSELVQGSWTTPVFTPTVGFPSVRVGQGGISHRAVDRLRFWDANGDAWGDPTGYETLGEHRLALDGMGFAMLAGNVARTFAPTRSDFGLTGSDVQEFAYHRASGALAVVDGLSVRFLTPEGPFATPIDDPSFEVSSLALHITDSHSLIAVGGIDVQQRPRRAQGEHVPGFATVKVDVYAVVEAATGNQSGAGQLETTLTKEFWPTDWNAGSPQLFFDPDGSRVLVTMRDTLFELEVAP